MSIVDGNVASIGPCVLYILVNIHAHHNIGFASYT